MLLTTAKKNDLKTDVCVAQTINTVFSFAIIKKEK